MATTTSITTNYVGEVAGEYIGAMIKQANTIEQNLITVLPNVVSPQFVRKIETADGFIDYVCGWDPGGSVTLSENELAPKKIKWDSDFCKEDFRQLWTSIEMGFSAFNDNLPATEQDAILMQMGKTIAFKIESDIWMGDGTTGNLAGLVPALLADGDVIDVGTPLIITVDNVEEQLGNFFDAIPDELIGGENMIYGVATNVIRILRRAYGSAGRSNGVFLQPDEFSFEGYTLTEIKGLASDHMVAYDKTQVFFGTGLLSDHNEIRIKDQDELMLDGTVRMKCVLTGGVQYAWGGEIVLFVGA